jgi:hypothetical protein
MHDLVKHSEAFAHKLQKQYESLVSDRVTTREILESRRGELAKMRDDELARLEQFYQQQKSMVSGIFSALLGEVDADLAKNADGLKRLTDESDDGGKAGRKTTPQAMAAE